MSVAGDATEEGGQEGGGEEPVELEPDLPKPAFELPDKPEEPAQPKLTGKEKHRQRGEGYSQQAQRFQAEAAEARREQQQLREQLAELRGRVDAGADQQRQNGVDPYQAKLKNVERGIENALVRMGNGDDSARAEWHELRREEQRLISRHEAEENAREVAARAPRPQDPVLASVTARYDWLMTDADARAIADGHVRRLVRLEKRDMSDPQVRKATLIQGAVLTERELGLGGGGNEEPSDTQRERYRGIGGQSTGASRSGKTVVALNGDQKAQAEALFRHLEPEAAHKKWWENVGAKITNK